MQKSWTGSAGHDLFVELRFDRGRRVGLEDGLRNAIRAGRLLAGTQLPSSRALARDLGLARGTVVEAYEQLIAEGYLTARRPRHERIRRRSPRRRLRPAVSESHSSGGPGTGRA